VQWYQPVARGLEQKIAEKLAHLRALDAVAKKTQQPVKAAQAAAVESEKNLNKPCR
jgi:putative ATPase